MPNMHYQSRLFIAYALVFICINAFFSLFYFWSAQLSYGLLIVGSSLTLPVVIRYGEVHWHGPNAFLFVVSGILSPLITVLPYALLSPWLKKWHVWIKICLSILWLAEILALGFVIPRMSFPS
jgi:hypothetical protein